MTRNTIFGISTTKLTNDEIELFKNHPPYGIILFKRNCEDEAQLKSLVSSIKETIPEVKILIDQEGGRVARLRKPNFIEFPAAKELQTEKEVYDNYFKMGKYLASFGIDINCAPVADLYYSFADNIVGDRSFGYDVERVSLFARAAANGLLDSGVIPVIKHIPGHGRALVDSHLELPIVETELNILEETDFAVFKNLQDLPFAMTAHVIYTALDSDLPVSVSPRGINYIRKELGFKGLIMSDDINMKALKGSLSAISTQVLEAGCDLLLHCSGDIDEMREVIKSI
jgi:beta-glucosidase-like glycosyl hydrolase